MNAFISPTLDAADLLALARLDDDGAPPAVSTLQAAGVQRSHAQATAPARGQQVGQAVPAGPGAGRQAIGGYVMAPVSREG
jgi:hypothetical protein